MNAVCTHALFGKSRARLTAKAAGATGIGSGGGYSTPYHPSKETSAHPSLLVFLLTPASASAYLHPNNGTLQEHATHITMGTDHESGAGSRYTENIHQLKPVTSLTFDFSAMATWTKLARYCPACDGLQSYF